MTQPIAHAPSAPNVYLVDDDEAIRDSLSWLFQSCGIT